ncbi:MAG: F0F1 ATP synthase subunit epsilon [Prevotellaceae bacterium]|nr:F0F1 ATP synthase subunit epsilon [Prevotellaceae bacterium]
MLKLKIVSPERVEYDGEAESVNVPGTLGNFEILTNHAPLISLLIDGTVVYVTPQGDRCSLPIMGGYVSVHKNEVSLCVEKAQV